MNHADCSFIASPTRAREPHARILVIFTDAAPTKAALIAADRLAYGLDLPITLLAPCIVPYPLPLDRPAVPVEFMEREMTQMVSGLSAEIAIHILLCRDAEEAVRRTLVPDSLIVLGTGTTAWKRRHRNLVRFLQAGGHHLVLID